VREVLDWDVCNLLLSMRVAILLRRSSHVNVSRVSHNWLLKHHRVNLSMLRNVLALISLHWNSVHVLRLLR